METVTFNESEASYLGSILRSIYDIRNFAQPDETFMRLIHALEEADFIEIQDDYEY